MKTIVLDCTLRDGGYCNNWKFGFEHTKQIIESLSSANVEIVECGYLTSNIQYDKNITKYSSVEEAERLIPAGITMRSQYVLMINYGEYDIGRLPELWKTRGDSKAKGYGKGKITGIRLAFHKKDKGEALEQARIIKEKGYYLYLQPMVSLSYTDEEFISLIHSVNEIVPYAFYIVDSFGTMKNKDLSRLYYIVEHNLVKEITIGFHSHNNMQLAYSNAQTLTNLNGKHGLIIDCCIYGMGRGAGNLNTELFLEYLNENFEGSYKIRPLIMVIDDILDDFYKQKKWGYSLPNYLSAAYNSHPNYAAYYSDKNTLTISDVDSILEMMEDEYRVKFDIDYAENLYIKYLSGGKTYEDHRSAFEKFIKKKEVLLIAPGKSSEKFKRDIKRYAKSKKGSLAVISINHEYQYIDTDYIFLSNLRRFRELKKEYRSKCIVTSNIQTSDAYIQTDYKSLLNKTNHVKDNAGLMAIKFLIDCGVHRIALVGFDGYSHDSMDNYADPNLVFITQDLLVDLINSEMEEELLGFMSLVEIKFLTPPKHLMTRTEAVL